MIIFFGLGVFSRVTIADGAAVVAFEGLWKKMGVGLEAEAGISPHPPNSRHPKRMQEINIMQLGF